MNGLPRLTIAAALAVLLTSLSLAPTMADLTWLRATVLCVGAVAFTGYAARRWRVPHLLVPVAELAVLAIVLTLRFGQAFAVWDVLPGRAAYTEARRLLAESSDTIHSYSAPAPVTPGLLFLIAMSVALVAVVVDTVAVTYRSPALAGLPLLVLYAVPVAVVTNGVSWVYFCIAAVGWLALLLADGRERLGGWGRRLGTRTFAGDPTTDVRSAPDPLGAVGRRIGFVSLAMAIALPAIIPGLSEAVFGRGGGVGNGHGRNTVKTINPFVTLGSELNQPMDNELFTYTSSSDSPDYLRLVTLDSFDGVNWVPTSLTSSSRVSDGALPIPDGLSAATERVGVHTAVRLTGLTESTWLPAPYPATSLTVEGDRARDWVWDLAHRIPWSANNDTTGLVYTVESLSVQPTRTQLENPEPVDPRVIAEDLKLPDGIRDEVLDLAETATAGVDAPFDKALKLQGWFHDNFSYDPAAQFDKRDPLQDFLRQRTGFCQQFAGTFAVMARALGIPTRVVVGFVPGDHRAEDDTWVVSAHDVHAWPEVYFQGTGWVRFEPTPRDDNTGVTLPAYTLAPTGVDPEGGKTASPNPGDPSSAASASPGQSGDVNLPRDRQGDAGALPEIQRPFPWVWVLVPLAVVVVLLLPFVIRVQQRRNRLARAGGPDPRTAAAAAWTELAASCADLGRSWPSSRTPRQVAQQLIDDARLDTTAPQSADALRRLALATERGRYARSPELVPGLATDVMTVLRGLSAAATPWQRLRARFAPVSLLSRAASRTADALDWVDAAPRQARRLVRRRRTDDRARSVRSG